MKRIAEWTSEVYSAFDRDHPEVFWLSDNGSVGKTIANIAIITDKSEPALQ